MCGNMNNITYRFLLEIQGNNKVLVPGCEPTSSSSSKTLSAYMAMGKVCQNALVDLNTALEAIPGSTVIFGNNFNKGIRQRWFALPQIDPTCPCDKYPDYYEMLRQIPGDELPISEEFDKCDLIGMGNCPSPDFNSVPAPEPSPYHEEGTFPVAGGILPPVPPWAVR